VPCKAGVLQYRPNHSDVEVFPVLTSGLNDGLLCAFCVFCWSDCFSRCQLISENAMSNVLECDDSTFSKDETYSASEPTLSNDQSSVRSLDSIVAYGIGHFSTCPIAHYQFALLLLLADMLKVGVLNSCGLI